MTERRSDNMYLELGHLTIQLATDNEPIAAYWRNWFGSWIRESADRVDMRLEATYVEELPALPDGEPYFIDRRSDTLHGPYSVLEAYRTADGRTVLHFFDGGYALLPLVVDESLPTVSCIVTSATFASGRLEDITLVALAPLLRAHGYYLMHSAAVALDGRALLLVGASGSGKTTTCLNLALNGWQLLSNDVVVLQQRHDGIYVLPLPDKITVRPNTLKLLPELSSYVIGEQFLDNVQLPTDILPTNQLVDVAWSPPARVTAICFPQVVRAIDSTIRTQIQPVTLARLLEESLDGWDRESLPAHAALLTAMTSQARGFTLQLGRDIDALPALLARLLA